MILSTSERQAFDPETLSRLHEVFRSCWREAEPQLSLSSEQQSSLRRTIASRILREAARGEVDERVIRHKALLDILPPNGLPASAST